MQIAARPTALPRTTSTATPIQSGRGPPKRRWSGSAIAWKTSVKTRPRRIRRTNFLKTASATPVPAIEIAMSVAKATRLARERSRIGTAMSCRLRGAEARHRALGESPQRGEHDRDERDGRDDADRTARASEEQ